MGPLKKPKIKIPKPDPVPTVDEAAQNQDMLDKLRRRRGRASTIMTGPLGDTSSPSVAVKKALGQ